MYDTTMFYITGPQESLKIQGGNQSKGKLTLHCGHHVSTNHRTKLIQDCNWLKKSCSNSRSFKREGFVKNWLEENGPLPLFPTALHIKILHKGSKCSLTSVKHAKIQIFNRLSFYVFADDKIWLLDLKKRCLHSLLTIIKFLFTFHLLGCSDNL